LPFVVCLSQTYQTNDRQPDGLRAVRVVHVLVLPGGWSPCRSSSDNVK
jgi:hypothetical protein